jgi:hypothetical protein
MFVWRLDSSVINSAVTLLVELAGNDAADHVERGPLIHPRERQRFDLNVSIHVRFERGVFLSAVGASRIDDEQIAVQLKAVAAAPGVVRELLGKRLGTFSLRNRPNSFVVQHDKFS